MPQADLQAAPQTSADEPHSYDVCFYRNRRPAFRFLARGVTLDRNGIACAADGASGAQPFAAIAAVHLKSSGAKVVVESCAITFNDGTMLTVVNCGPGGHADAARGSAYRAFVHDLHARLAAGGFSGIRFSEGWPLWQCQAMLALTALIALTAPALGLYVFACTGNLRGLLLTALAAYACWKFYRTALNNLPRDYTPDRLPDFLLS